MDQLAEEQLTKLRSQLKELCDEVAASPALQAHPFLRELSKQKPPIAPDDIYRYCLETDPNRLLWKISNAISVVHSDLASAHADDSGKVSDLVSHITLVASERLISQELAGNPRCENGVPTVSMMKEVAAAVVAASWLDLGLKLRLDGEGGIKVANLINDHAEVQFGVKTLEQAIDDEIIDRVTQSLSVRTNRLNPNRRLLPSYVRAGIDELEEQTGARLVVGLPLASGRHSVDGSLRENIKKRWDVALFAYSDSGATIPEQEREQWELVENTLVEHFESILPPLYRVRTESGALASKRAGIAKPKVFICYAHANDGYRRLVVTHLKGLALQNLIELWDDERIEAGDEWRKTIDEHLTQCDIAILLVSAEFLSSDFIQGVEAPKLRERQKREGIRLVFLLIEACAWDVHNWIEERQMRPVGAKPLSPMSREEQAEELSKLTTEIAGFAKELASSPEKLDRP